MKKMVLALVLLISLSVSVPVSAKIIAGIGAGAAVLNGEWSITEHVSFDMDITEKVAVSLNVRYLNRFNMFIGDLSLSYNLFKSNQASFGACTGITFIDKYPSLSLGGYLRVGLGEKFEIYIKVSGSAQLYLYYNMPYRPNIETELQGKVSYKLTDSLLAAISYNMVKSEIYIISLALNYVF